MTISTDRSGTGAPSLIFIHGGACDRTDWTLQMAALSLHFEVITLDLPGHGESAPPDETSIDALARSVVEVKNSVAGPCILIGHSMGCRVIVQAYGHSPEGITGLIFVDGSLAAMQGDEAAAEMAAEKIEALGVEAFLEYSFEQMFVPTSSPLLRDRIVARARRWDPNLAVMLLTDTIRWDARKANEALANIKVPVLMLQSSHVDHNFARRSLLPGMSTPWTQLVTRLVPGAELLIVEGAGHFPHIEAATAVNAGIERFARRRVMVSESTMSVKVHVVGDAEPSILFVHGGFCDRLDWSAQIDALAPHFRCISFDLPGHGEAAIPRVTSVAALAQSVADITRRVNRPAIMVGHSLGCALILEAYQRAPERIGGVVLLDGGLVGNGDPTQAVNLTRDMLEVVGLNQFVTRSFAAMFSSGSNQDFKNQVLSRATRMDPEFSRQLLLSIAAWGRDEAGRALRALAVPLLVLQSTHLNEQFQFESLCEGDTTPWIDLVKLNNPQARVAIIPGVGHFAMREAASSISDQVRQFANDLASTTLRLQSRVSAPRSRRPVRSRAKPCRPPFVSAARGHGGLCAHAPNRVADIVCHQ